MGVCFCCQGDGRDVFGGCAGGPTFNRNHTEHGGPDRYEQSRGLLLAKKLNYQPVN